MPIGGHGTNDTGSTLANLHPAMRFAPAWNIPRHSPRPSGTHRLTYARPTREGVWSRPYLPGDPVRLIDWKTLARTDHLVLRQERPESSASVSIVLDCSETMRWPDPSVPARVARNIPRKIEIAGRVAFHLAHAHALAGDRVTIHLLRDLETLPQRRLAVSDPMTLVGQHDLWEDNQFAPGHLLDEAAPHSFADDRCDLCVWISDLLGTGSLDEAVGSARSTICVQVLSSLERDSSWFERETCYFDGSLRHREYRGRTLTQQEHYQTSINSWIASVDAHCHQLDVDRLLVDETTPVGTLHGFVADRVQEKLE